MQETGCRLAYLNDQDPDYPFGDWNDQKNARKTEDSACFGPFKMNWGQIRTKYKPYKDMNLQPEDYRTYGDKIKYVLCGEIFVLALWPEIWVHSISLLIDLCL